VDAIIYAPLYFEETARFTGSGCGLRDARCTAETLRTRRFAQRRHGRCAKPGTFLGNRPMVEALLSRLRNYCHTVTIEGSFAAWSARLKMRGLGGISNAVKQSVSLDSGCNGGFWAGATRRISGAPARAECAGRGTVRGKEGRNPPPPWGLRLLRTTEAEIREGAPEDRWMFWAAVSSSSNRVSRAG
jgi:hypothetical protein